MRTLLFASAVMIVFLWVLHPLDAIIIALVLYILSLAALVPMSMRMMRRMERMDVRRTGKEDAATRGIAVLIHILPMMAASIAARDLLGDDEDILAYPRFLVGVLAGYVFGKISFMADMYLAGWLTFGSAVFRAPPLERETEETQA